MFQKGPSAPRWPSGGDEAENQRRRLEALRARVQDLEREAFLDYLEVGCPCGENREGFERWLETRRPRP
jgi:hypothetical protein